MTEENNGESRSSEEYTILNLESLLRKKMGHVIVQECKTKNLLPPGENYGSLVLKVDVVLKCYEGTEEKKKNLHLIAKVPPLTQVQRDMFDSPYTFGKESFMYETILPAYKELEKECGISDEDVLDIGPEFYGSRLSLADNDDFDLHAVILMENLKIRDYYTCSRYTGFDLSHSILAVRAMAKFHAIGIAMKTKNPEFFQTLKLRSKCLEFKDAGDWKPIGEEILRSIKEDPILNKNYDKISKAFSAGNDSTIWLATPEEPWSTIIHADFWVNNILFHRDDESGEPDDVKFVDFQNYLFFNPLRELGFCLGADVNLDVSRNHIEELVNVYYDTFISRLTMMNCDISPYGREAFDKGLREQSYVEFSHILFMLKIITKEVDANDPHATDVKSMMMNECSDIFFVRVRDLVERFVNNGII